MGKIAVDLQRALAARAHSGSAGRSDGRLVAHGDGWRVDDVICTFGPEDRLFEERHTRVSIALVVAGSFQYRTPSGHDLLTPGAFLLGNAGQCFECSHVHAPGDRCVAFNFEPSFFDRVAADTGALSAERTFRVPRLPPLRALSGIVARAALGALQPADVAWEELAVEVAAAATRVPGDLAHARRRPERGIVSRVTRSVRAIERDSAARLPLGQLAAHAGVSPYHYLRTFQEITGVTPHQFILRTRLREAATRLAAERTKVIDVALESGFDDVSNFNRAFRGEFGVTPRAWRARVGRGVVRPGP